MRVPRLPPLVSRALELAVAMAVAVVLVLQLWRLGGWLELLICLPTIAAVSLFWPLPVPDDEGCLKCGHARIHHQGNCQACLRDVARGEQLSTPVPCARFQRWSPRTRWALALTFLRARRRRVRQNVSASGVGDV
jgi:hypothetical protein